MTPLLDVQHLTVAFERPGPALKAVDDLSFSIQPGETLGLVGESGSGKSVTALAILRLLQPPGKVTAGRVLFEGRDLLQLPESEMRSVRGGRISLIFQEPMTALNPTMRVGDQIGEALTSHAVGKDQARQRVMIAIAVACRPPLVIADEPTTALDVTIQAQVLEMLSELKGRFNLALLLITHDFGVIAEMADRVAVMRGGQLVEQGPVRQILRTPSHEYTQRLLRAVPGMSKR